MSQKTVPISRSMFDKMHQDNNIQNKKYMKHEINTTSSLWLHANRADLLIRLPEGFMAASWLSIALGLAVSIMILFTWSHWNLFMPALFMIVVPICILTYKEEIAIDLEQRTYIRKNKICTVCLQTIFIKWEENYYFSYAVRYENMIIKYPALYS